MYHGNVIERRNRFLVSVKYNGRKIDTHLHDPGRLSELIYPGNDVIFREASGKKTAFSITAAKKDGNWILTDSRFHNALISSFFRNSWKSEVTLGKSRIDFFSSGYYVEIKGCSLEKDGIAMFPDAPSIRASRQLADLTNWVLSGGKAALIVLVFSPVSKCFMPNATTDPLFSGRFKDAIDAGVKCAALRFRTDDQGISFTGTIPIKAW